MKREEEVFIGGSEDEGEEGRGCCGEDLDCRGDGDGCCRG